MSSLFKSKDITDFTLGEILQEQRRIKKEDLSLVSKELKIDIKYLKALENGEYGNLPAGIYGKSFLRQYGEYLGLNYSKLAKIYDQESDLSEDLNNSGNVFSYKRAKKSYFLSLPKIIRNIILVLIILTGFFYLGLKFKEITAPPKLDVNFPHPGHITEENKIVISGNTEKNARVFINDKEILVDNQGNFNYQIDLKNGINAVKIKANKRYSRTAEIIRQVLVK